MHAARANTAQVLTAPSSADGGSGQLYIINLVSANTPMALEAPDAPELGGLAVFRSRRVEDGRDRFRLHLGYFDSQEQAEEFLPVVRGRYPAAWVAMAPEDSMGSLDDTSVAQFKYIPRRNEPAAPAAAPAAQPAPVKAAPAADPAALSTTVPAGEFLEAEDVLSLLESPPPPPQIAAPPPAVMQSDVGPATEQKQTLPAVQSFAVQLVWSTDKPDTTKLPHLAIFDAYTMYTVTMKRAGRLWYGLRLGFFNDPVSARQVSLYVRADFAAAAVVPVSERECDRAGEAAKAAVAKEAVVRQQQRAQAEKKTEFTLAPEPAPAPRKAMMDAMVKPQAKEIATAQANFRQTLKSLDGGGQDTRFATKRPAAGKNKPLKPVRMSTGAARRGAFTTEQLLEELGAGEVSFEGEGHDQFTDTGVRHLAVSVVKKRKRMSGFFSRSPG